ncbi:2-nitropropane dioxygenase, NPD [Hyaloraphidium curvatum]|nr:2-nitropropane dioxygenase, NPD [Hyaloraphidium curvatum]
MSKPAWLRTLRLPLISAPMFLVSNPDTVLAACRAGIVGSLPALNARTAEQLDEWLSRIGDGLRDGGQKAREPGPHAVNLIVHKTNPRLKQDLAVVKKHAVPLVITSLGAVPDVVAEVQSWGGKVFHDVTNAVHAKKAAAAGVDGLILVCAGAGGHAGVASPFALVQRIREFFDGTVVLAGAMSDGRSLLAARALGADLAYMGTRFLATKEAAAQERYKQMIVEADAGPPPTFMPVTYTDRVSGIPANFLRASLEEHGISDSGPKGEASEDWISNSESKAWKDIWSAGQGVMNIHDVPSIAELVDRLEKEYLGARKQLLVE